MKNKTKTDGRGKNQLRLKALRRAQRKIKQEMAEKTIPNCGLYVNPKITKNLIYLRVNEEIKNNEQTSEQ